MISELLDVTPLPVLNSDYFINNFDVADTSDTTESVIYTGGHYYVEAKPIVDVVNKYGYTYPIDGNGNDQTHYGFVENYAQTLQSDEGGQYQTGADNTYAPYVWLRRVIAGNDITLQVGDSFDAATNTDMAIQVFDRSGAAMDLAAAGITIDSSAVNTAVPGEYPVVVNYADAAIPADSAERTMMVTVEALQATPIAPTQVDDQVTIPTVTGVDYQVNGETVTGTITVPDGQTVTVTAVPQSGYEFPEDADTSWDFTYNMPRVTPIDPTQVDDQVTIPTVPGVDYQIDGETVTGVVTVPDGETVHVTTKPQDGYKFTDDNVYEWDFSYAVPVVEPSGAPSTDQPAVATSEPAAESAEATGAEVGTGGSATNGLLPGLAVIAMGAGALIARRRH